MDKDIFGNLTDWGTVLDQIEALKQSQSLDGYQSGLMRILRYKDNWKLRETVLSCLKELRHPGEAIMDEVWGIMMDETGYFDQRILAADCLSHLAGNHQLTNPTYLAKAIDGMRKLLDSPLPPVFHKAIENALCRLEDPKSAHFHTVKPTKTKERKAMRKFRIRGLWYEVSANCLRDALKKLVDSDGDFQYTPHWYTRTNRKSWASFTTSYGYTGIVEEV